MTALQLKFPPKIRPLAEELRGSRYRHIILKGGRGSAKSWSIARVLVAYTYGEPLRVICLRETQKSIKESSHRLIGDQIQAMGLGGVYDIQRDGIYGPKGSEFAFAGLKEHTADSIKSYEGFDIAWIEEAHAVKERSANVLIPTLRKPNSKLIWSYNPDQEDDFVHKLAGSGRDDVLVIEINWSDNPYFPKELEIERLAMKALNDDLYSHIWSGKCRSAAGLLFKRRWFRRFNLGEQPSRLNLYMASDWAGAPDPDEPDREPDYTEHGVWGVDPNGELWAVDWWSGQEDPEVWIQAWLALGKRFKSHGNGILAAFEEKGMIHRVVDGSIDKAMRQAKFYMFRKALASAGSKADRALGFAAQASAGVVHIPNTPWGDRLVEQLCAFNGQDGRTDDMVDVCSLVGRGIDEMRDALPEPTPEERGVKPFTAQWLKSGDRPATPAKRY